MAFWFKRKREQTPELLEISLPGDIGNVSIPSSLAVGLEDDSTLMAWPEESDEIILRITSISFTKANDDSLTARNHVRERAVEKGYEYFELDEKGIAAYETESIHDDVPLLLKFWEIGSQNTIVILSATILKVRRNSSIVKKTLQFVPGILESLEVNTVHQIIEANESRIETTVQTVDPVPQEITPFGSSELAWLEENLKRAHAMSLTYGSGGELDPEELDRVFSRWTSEEGDKESPEVVANVLGAAFGNVLVDGYGFRWVVVNDEYGTEYAVRHTVGETTAFPRCSVEKRIEDGQTEFFQNVYLVIVEQLQRAQSG